MACRDEKVPTYRVFEKQWEQVILLWAGNNFLSKKLNIEFVSKLTDFTMRDFYCHRAYCLAGLIIDELDANNENSEVFDKIIEWGFGRFNYEERKWYNYHM